MKIKLFIFCFLTVIYSLNCFAQEKQISKTLLDGNKKQEVIDTCLSAFEKYYIYPDVVLKMKTYITEQKNSDVYEEIANLMDLTKQMRRDLRDISGDGHIWIDIIENIRLTPGPPTVAEIARKKKDNFGFVSLKKLKDNIGYLKLNSFQDPSYAGEAAVQAISFFADCHAVIIDLRDNHGGDGRMVQLISSYFLPARTQLNSLYFRAADSLQEAWTYDEVEGERLLDVDLYILVSKQTASAAESFSYSLQNYQRAKIVGENTRGAAHWTETYSYPDLGIYLEIPVARPINPVTEKGWEGIGVEPDIKVDAAEAFDKALLLAREKNVTGKK